MENVEQFDPRVRFKARVAGGMLWLTRDALWLTVTSRAPSLESQEARLTAKPLRGGVWDPARGTRAGVHLKLSLAGNGLEYSALLGGSARECLSRCAIAVDGDGVATVVGDTEANDFPTVAGSYDPSFNGDCDVFVTRSDTVSGALRVSTFPGARSPTMDAPSRSARTDLPTASAKRSRPTIRRRRAPLTRASTEAWQMRSSPSSRRLLFVPACATSSRPLL